MRIKVGRGKFLSNFHKQKNPSFLALYPLVARDGDNFSSIYRSSSLTHSLCFDFLSRYNNNHLRQVRTTACEYMTTNWLISRQLMHLPSLNHAIVSINPIIVAILHHASRVCNLILMK